MVHGLKGVFINTNVVLGKNVTIYQQVTIGQRNPEDIRGAVIGDNVLIGAGAKILGNVHIGNNVRIGANAVVVTDIPDNAIVYMKSQIIQK